MVNPNLLLGMVALVSLALAGWVALSLLKRQEPWARGPLPAPKAAELADDADEADDDGAEDDDVDEAASEPKARV